MMNSQFLEEVVDEAQELIENKIKYENRLLSIRFADEKDRNEKKVRRIASSLRDLRRICPKILDDYDEDTPEDYVLNMVLPTGVMKRVFFTNLSFTNNYGRTRNVLSMRIAKEGAFLQEVMPEGKTIALKGHVNNGKFIVESIRVVLDSGPRDHEVEAQVVSLFKTPMGIVTNDFFLNDILNNTDSIARYTQEKLALWEEYLQWKRKYASSQIYGCKYFRITADHIKKQLIFWMVTEGKEEFDDFRAHIRKDLEVFTNSYSENRWRFRLNQENEKALFKDKSVKIGKFKKIIKEYYLEKNHEKNYEQEYENELLDKFDAPYVVGVAFGLSERDEDEIFENNFDEQETMDFFQEKIKNDYPEEGFLAVSCIGDLVLISRLERAIKKIKNDENYNPNLAVWLFDIQKAEMPVRDENIEITKWLNNKVADNEDQRKAVLKMLEAQDICLIQGPPGTGKTTVIAEAVYQFVSRGKRVMIASQSNDAVDNALERLGDNSMIRAIRLGRKHTKASCEDQCWKYAEENVLMNFYSNLSQEIKERWLTPWDRAEILSGELAKDLRDAEMLKQDREKILKHIFSGEEKLESLKQKRKQEKSRIQEIQVYNKEQCWIKNQGSLFLQLIKGQKTVSAVLPSCLIEIVMEIIEPLIDGFKEIGIYLEPKKLDIRECGSNHLKNENLNQIIEAFIILTKLREKLKTIQGDKKLEGEELKILQRKKRYLQDEMDKLDEEDAADEEFAKIYKQMRMVNKKLRKLKADENIVSLTQGEMQLFDGDYRDNIQGLKDKLNEGEKLIQKFCLGLSAIQEKVERYGKSLDMLDISGAEKALEDTNQFIEEVKLKRNIRKEELGKIDEKLALLKKKYSLEDAENEGELLKEIQRKREDNQGFLQNNREFKASWKQTLADFNTKLCNHKYIENDIEHYQDIYVNACNVVGVSCTNNTRNLTARGYDEFDVVIIDEVSKATPPELLIPLINARKAVLVGDHRQLPPLFNYHEKSYNEILENFTLEEEASETLLTQENFLKFKHMVTASLFKEYFENADKRIKHSLLTQYRMHSQIMNIINRFYEGALKCGYSRDEEERIKAHNLEIKGLKGEKFIRKDKHAYWIDSARLPDGEEFYETRPMGSSSTENIHECFIIIELLKKIAEVYASEGHSRNNAVSVGVISFYQLQVNRLRNMIKKARKKSDLSALKIDVNTVDRFQGKEKEIVITSLVRNKKNSYRSEKSHIAAFERINVAFSRAQNLLVIVGAKDMYANQPVKLPNMEGEGEKSVYVYKNIIEELDRKACFFGSNKLISREKSEEIKVLLDEMYGGKQ